MSVSLELSKHVFFDAKEVIKVIPPVEQHCHTNFTDGNNSVEEMVLAAIKKKLKRIIITEHIQRKSTWVEKFIQQVEKCRLKFANQIEVYYGFEAKVTNYEGELDIPEEIFKLKDVIILGSVHGYPLEGQSNKFYEFNELNREKALELELKLMKALAKNESVDIISHPLGVFVKNYGDAPESAHLETVKIAKEYGKVLELNCKYDTNLKLLLKLCLQHKVRLNIGSDAHGVEEVGKISEVIKDIRRIES